MNLLISSLGLKLERNDVRFAAANRTRTRSYAFFAATGQPLKMSLDDGSWNSSEARLTRAEPPPRRSPAPDPPSAAPARQARSARAPAQPVRDGPALTPQSTWATPSQTPPAAKPSAPAATPEPRPRPPPDTAPPKPRVPPSDSEGSRTPPTRSRRRRQRRQDTPSTSLSDQVVAELRQLITTLQEEMRALRRENRLLRESQVTAERRLAERPLVPTYSMLPAAGVPSSTSLLPPVPTLASPDIVVPTNPLASDLSMTPEKQTHQRDPGSTPDGKRPVVRALEVNADHVS